MAGVVILFSGATFTTARNNVLDLLAKFSKLPVIPITKLYFNSLKHKIGANLKLFTGYTLVAFISLAVEDSLKDFC